MALQFLTRLLTRRRAPNAESFPEVAGPDTLDLAQGSPRFDLVASTSTWLPADRRGPPPLWGLPELQGAVGGWLAREEGMQVSPSEEVFITAGAAGALAVALDALVRPGDGVALFDPTSALYPVALRPRRVRIRWVPTWTEAGRLRFRFDRLARALRKARLLILASPSSPTGGTFAAEDLEQIAWWAVRLGVRLLEDRVFARFQFEGERTCLAAIPEVRTRVLTVGGVSKGHGLASARVGWLAGDRRLLAACAAAAAGQGRLVPTVCQQLACTALTQSPDGFAPLLDDLAARRHYVFERLQAFGLCPSWPAGAFFFWLPVEQLQTDGRGFADRLLREQNVLVWPGHFFGPSGRGHVRLSYLTEEGRLREGLARLGDLVRQLQGVGPAVRQVRIAEQVPPRAGLTGREPAAFVKK
jgi:aspartate/methionine/tyrosine aminotransferase